MYNTDCDNPGRLSQWSRPQCAKYFNKWNKRRQCKLGMTWRSLPQGNYFCFAHPLVGLTSMSFLVLKKSCVPKMILFFFKKENGKEGKGMRINKGYQLVVCVCVLVLLPRTTLATSLQMCLLRAAGQQWWALGCSASHLELQELDPSEKSTGGRKPNNCWDTWKISACTMASVCACKQMHYSCSKYFFTYFTEST